MPPPVVEALVPAAGRGHRFGGDRPKQYLVVRGRPLLAWTLERLLAGGVARCTVALPADRLAAGDLPLEDPRVRFVAGGGTRQDSVAACLAAAAGDGGDLVLVHDGARPAISREDLDATVAAAERHGGAVLGRPVADTLKRLDGGRIVGTVDREGLFRAETPQAFRRSLLQQALAAAARDRFVGTDEASLVERVPGARVVAVEAARPNPKLTRPADLAEIEALLDGRH